MTGRAPTEEEYERTLTEEVRAVGESWGSWSGESSESAGERTTETLKADQSELLALRRPCSTAMYLVRTVCELMRLKSETGPPARMHEDMLRVLAVFLEGLDIMATWELSKLAQGAEARGDSGSAMSRTSWKFFALKPAGPET